MVTLIYGSLLHSTGCLVGTTKHILELELTLVFEYFATATCGLPWPQESRHTVCMYGG